MIKILTETFTDKLLNCAWFADTFGSTDDEEWMLPRTIAGFIPLICEKIIDAGRKKFDVVCVSD